ncbi:MOSC domain-containing protein [Variovorax sp.]|uniref:MOSC domain-containing protein n=1 Tax=Variovorax sp. TaxID=1871043 RepID=UPI002D27C265|nr:MOSC N-terminal beta barrel domain-containing protein [Variovorax sp.]HYP83324.1 MOSC N-terminal beta barrel domain-containing protein [Variovorax sp.]
MNAAEFDLQATIARLFVYPIKSCAGVEVRESLLIESGLEFDRAWMVVDEAGEFVTQRDLPRMALIRPTMKYSEMVLRAPGMLALHIAFDRVEAPMRVRVWKDEVAAYDMGDVAAQWFSDFLSEPGKPQRLRLVRFDPEHKRLASRKWTGDAEAPVEFADGYPLLVLSQASLDGLNQRLAAAGHAAVGIERFRPNIVLAGIEAHDEDRVDELRLQDADGEVRLRPVKPCTRCPIPDIDPATATRSPEVGDMLRTYRADARVDGAITFGMNAIVLDGVERSLAVGQAVGANLRFE